MNILDTDLEDIRILSILTEKPYSIKTKNGCFGCFGGIVVPYNLIVVFTLWQLTESTVYRQFITSKPEYLNQIKMLNQNNKKLIETCCSDLMYVYHIFTKLKENWSNEDLESAIISEF